MPIFAAFWDGTVGSGMTCGDPRMADAESFECQQMLYVAMTHSSHALTAGRCIVNKPLKPGN